MIDKDAIALRAAKILLDTKSVLFNVEDPFTLTSGKRSPVYIDCRRLISFPAARTQLMNDGAAMLREATKDKPLELLAGGETAGIPYAAFLSERLDVPMLYVRKKPKGFGRMAQIEGHMDKDGQNVALIEDLQTDGGSKKLFVDVLRAAGANVEHAFVVFHYGIFDASEKNMKDLGITLHSLTDWWAVLKVAEDMQYFDVNTLAEVKKFLQAPTLWQEQFPQSA
jgi:orotate phosphoribosyltransferase